MSEPKQESRLFGISSRGWITFVIVYTICVMSATQIEIPSVLSHALSTVLGFYFGQKGKA